MASQKRIRVVPECPLQAVPTISDNSILLEQPPVGNPARSIIQAMAAQDVQAGPVAQMPSVTRQKAVLKPNAESAKKSVALWIGAAGHSDDFDAAEISSKHTNV